MQAYIRANENRDAHAYMHTEHRDAHTTLELARAQTHMHLCKHMDMVMCMCMCRRVIVAHINGYRYSLWPCAAFLL